jgi:hypothetical protein
MVILVRTASKILKINRTIRQRQNKNPGEGYIEKLVWTMTEKLIMKKKKTASWYGGLTCGRGEGEWRRLRW